MRPKKPAPDRIDEEIAFHIEQQTAKHLRAGMNAEDARRAALIEFGAIEGLREGARDEVRGAWLRDIARDLRISFRSLRRMPSFSAATILTLGLGLGAAVAMFSVVNAVLLRPLPYPDSDGIVRLFQVSERGNRSNVSGPNFFDWRDGTKSFSQHGAHVELVGARANHGPRRTAPGPVHARLAGVLRRLRRRPGARAAVHRGRVRDRAADCRGRRGRLRGPSRRAGRARQDVRARRPHDHRHRHHAARVRLPRGDRDVAAAQRGVGEDDVSDIRELQRHRSPGTWRAPPGRARRDQRRLAGPPRASRRGRRAGRRAGPADSRADDADDSRQLEHAVGRGVAPARGRRGERVEHARGARRSAPQGVRRATGARRRRFAADATDSWPRRLRSVCAARSSALRWRRRRCARSSPSVRPARRGSTPWGSTGCRPLRA